MANSARDKLVLLDGVKWYDAQSQQPLNVRVLSLTGLCREHSLRLEPIGGFDSSSLACSEGPHIIQLPRPYNRQRRHVINKIDSLAFANMPLLNIGDEAIPVAKDVLKDTDYWVEARVTKSKSGTRLIVWAGSKKEKNKAQLFIEPEIKRLSFDQNDTHPLEVFTKVEALFADGVSASLEKD